METALALPFTVNSYGTVNSTIEQSKIWSDRVRAVIGTNIGERIMNPDFGTVIPEAFMQTTDDAENTVKTEVERAFANELTQLTFSSVETSFDEYTNSLNVTITYSLPNSEQTTTTIGIITVPATLPSTQENL
jgi:phage baseplate assembly protein W